MNVETLKNIPLLTNLAEEELSRLAEFVVSRKAAKGSKKE